MIENGTFKCTMCSKKYFDRRSIERHYREDHSEYCKCPFCHFVTRNGFMAMKRHVMQCESKRKLNKRMLSSVCACCCLTLSAHPSNRRPH